MTMYCPRCGHPEVEPVTFCRLCGLPIAEHANLLNEATDTERILPDGDSMSSFKAATTNPLEPPSGAPTQIEPTLPMPGDSSPPMNAAANPHESSKVGMLRALLRALVDDVKRARRRSSIRLLLTLTYSAPVLYERADDEGALDSLSDECKDVLLRAYETMTEFGHYVEQRQRDSLSGRKIVDTGILLMQLGPEALRLAQLAADLLEPEIDRLARMRP